MIKFCRNRFVLSSVTRPVIGRCWCYRVSLWRIATNHVAAAAVRPRFARRRPMRILSTKRFLDVALGRAVDLADAAVCRIVCRGGSGVLLLLLIELMLRRRLLVEGSRRSSPSNQYIIVIIVEVWNRLRWWWCGYNYDSTSIRRPFDCLSKVIKSQ